LREVESLARPGEAPLRVNGLEEGQQVEVDGAQVQ
jgi:hypothetical protein